MHTAEPHDAGYSHRYLDRSDLTAATTAPPGDNRAEHPRRDPVRRRDARRTSRNLELPESYRAAFVKKDEVDMFEGLASRDKDPRKSLHVDDVALPELGPGEALVAVMASAPSTTTPSGPRSSSRSRPSASSSATAGCRRSPQAPRPALPRRRLRPVRRRAQDRRRACTPGSPATRSSPTASPSSSRAPTATTTRCSTPSSGSGASRPTSAASPTSRWSSPTS